MQRSQCSELSRKTVSRECFCSNFVAGGKGHSRVLLTFLYHGETLEERLIIVEGLFEADFLSLPPFTATYNRWMTASSSAVEAILNLPSAALTVASSTFLLSNFSSITCLSVLRARVSASFSVMDLL